MLHVPSNFEKEWCSYNDLFLLMDSSVFWEASVRHYSVDTDVNTTFVHTHLVIVQLIGKKPNQTTQT